MTRFIGQKFKFFLTWLLVCILTLFTGCQVEKPSINIAVASNFEPHLKNILKKYKSISNYQINIISGSSGLLSSQIINGAPYDLFLSADEEKTKILSSTFNNLTLEPTVYAVGQITLWIPSGNDNDRCLEQLDNIQTLAIANPETAPYGKVAMQIIEQNQIQKNKIINTSNVNQAFIYTKQAITDAGFIPHSSLVLHQIKTGCRQIFKNYQLKQPMLLINPKAKSIYNFILSEQIQSYISESGYTILSS